MQNYKVFITTSGFGERLSEYTKYWNKSLILVGTKPVIAYIIEKYPKDVELVIAIRYLGWQIKDFVLQAYPDRKIIFSEEPNDPPSGAKFSLGFSMLMAKQYLQCPFVFNCGDTIINEPIPSPENRNWNYGFRASNSTHYTTFDIVDGKISLINEKGAKNFQLAHIGLVGIKDYALFWESLVELYTADPTNTALNDTRAINVMLKKGVVFEPLESKTWLDIGNPESLKNARQKIREYFPN
jgi:NDP-sugar pyrophosphorylase family protein